MKYYIFRNHTIDAFFGNLNCSFSGYEDISFFDNSADRYIWFYLPDYKTNPDLISLEIDNYLNMLDLTINNTDSNKMFIIFSIASVFQLKYQQDKDELKNSIIKYNQKIRELSLSHKNIRLVEIADFFNNYSEKELVDWKYYFIAKIPVNPKLSTAFKKWFSRQIEIIELKRKKCIVLDLDNTLWGGVIGEDGIEGVKIGEDYPGKIYLMFQKFLLELSKTGIILTVCSKNNENDVLELWEKHPNQLIKKNDIVAYRINWNNKADNIIEIANELNIGLDSMVFIDDNPTERELVKQILPMVEVPDFPDHIYAYPLFMHEINERYFQIYKLTDEDLQKTKLYIDNTKRALSKSEFADFDGYLKSLDIKLKIEALDDFNLTRFAQMTQKTNQFNLTTKRYDESEIISISKSGNLILGLRVEDKFGDNGLTGLIIISIEGMKASIDTFLMSCRILGKNIETAFLTYVLHVLKKNGITEVNSCYIESVKNIMVSEFYIHFGFEIIKKENTTTFYKLNLNSFEGEISKNYKLEV